MCGIFAYIGKREAAPILLGGLAALEYRGYDSAGLFIAPGGALRSVGPVEALVEKEAREKCIGTRGIAHTRWATHGIPSEENTHPHTDCSGTVWLVHNGIIENYQALKETLKDKGHAFRSETDTEVLAHLIEDEGGKATSFSDAVRLALQKVEGTYGIAAIRNATEKEIVIARMGSPIVLGIGNDEYFASSDPSAILRHTEHVLFLEDGEIAVLTSNGYRAFTFERSAVKRAPTRIEWNVEGAQKKGYPHFMLKEIMEEPDVLVESARGRILREDGTAKLGGIEDVAEALRNIERVIIVGCGSAYYAGLVGALLLEELGDVHATVEIASEFRYRESVLNDRTALLAISQSGETADTLASVREAKRRGILTLGIVNAVGSTIARDTDAGIYNHAGPEIGVASTKAFLSQLEVLVFFALYLGRQRNLSLTAGKNIAEELLRMPEKMRGALESFESIIPEITKKYSAVEHLLVLGRRYNAPIALEGALKIKEVSYIHAEGYPAGEMKHGPLAMIDETFPTIAIVPHDSVYEKTVSNIEEIKARKGSVLAIATEGDEVITRVADDTLYIPSTLEPLSPLLTILPLQLLAYHMGVLRGYNVDRPRNLAKSVTVE